MIGSIVFFLNCSPFERAPHECIAPCALVSRLWHSLCKRSCKLDWWASSDVLIVWKRWILFGCRSPQTIFVAVHAEASTIHLENEVVRYVALACYLVSQTLLPLPIVFIVDPALRQRQTRVFLVSCIVAHTDTSFDAEHCHGVSSCKRIASCRRVVKVALAWKAALHWKTCIISYSLDTFFVWNLLPWGFVPTGVWVWWTSMFWYYFCL